MKRIDALRIIDKEFDSNPLVITCGATAREMASVSKRSSHLPLLDSMGLTTPVGLGIALGSDEKVGVIDGDGSLLMGFSILPTLRAYAPKNLLVIVLDNGQHASADQMYSQANVVDIAGAAEGIGISVSRCDSEKELSTLLSTGIKNEGFSMIFVKIEPGNTAGIPFYLADPAQLGRNFADYLSNI